MLEWLKWVLQDDGESRAEERPRSGAAPTDNGKACPLEVG